MWTSLLAAIIGIWLLAAPGVLQYGGAARTNEHIVGALMATVGLIATSESMRAVRWLNVLLGLWLMLSPMVLDYAVERATPSLFAGIAAVILGSIRGRVSERMGGGWAALWS